MWFDTILWLVAIVAFIMVEALAGRCLFLPLYRPLRSA